MVEFAGDDTMEDALDTTTVQAGAAADETDGGRTDCANDDEGGVRRGGGGADVDLTRPEGVGRPLGRAVASSFF